MDFQIGQNIRKVRELKDYSQEFMTQQLGVSQKTYSNIENDKSKVDKDILQKIAGILEVDPINLLTFDEKHLFSNYYGTQKGVLGLFNTVHGLQMEERDLYQQQISQLEEQVAFLKEEIAFLRGMLEKNEK